MTRVLTFLYNIHAVRVRAVASARGSAKERKTVMQTSLVKVVLMAGFAASVRCAVAGTIDVGIGGDLASAIRNAADGDVIRLAAGRYELASALELANRTNLALLGGGGYVPDRYRTG